MRVRSLGQEDALEEAMATHSSILFWRIPQTEQPGGLLSVGSKESDTTEVTQHARPCAGWTRKCPERKSQLDVLLTQFASLHLRVLSPLATCSFPKVPSNDFSFSIQV